MGRDAQDYSRWKHIHCDGIVLREAKLEHELPHFLVSIFLETIIDRVATSLKAIFYHRDTKCSRSSGASTVQQQDNFS